MAKRSCNCANWMSNTFTAISFAQNEVSQSPRAKPLTKKHTGSRRTDRSPPATSVLITAAKMLVVVPGLSGQWNFSVGGPHQTFGSNAGRVAQPFPSHQVRRGLVGPTRLSNQSHLPKCSTWNILSGYCCTYNTIWTLTAYETTETGYSAASAKEDFPAAGFGGGGRRSADAIAGEAAILQGDQEADYVVSGCRRSGLVQKSWTGVPDADQSGALEGDDGREEDIRGMRLDALKTTKDVAASASPAKWPARPSFQ